MNNEDFLKYEKMLISICNSYVRKKSILDYGELYSAGAEGMVNGFNSFKTNKNTKISTHIYNHIHYAILNELKEYKRLEKQYLVVKELDQIQLTVVSAEKEAVENLTLQEYIDEFQLILSCRELDILLNRYIENIPVSTLAFKYRVDTTRISEILSKSKSKLQNKSYLLRKAYRNLLVHQKQQLDNEYINPATYTEIEARFSSNINYLYNLDVKQLKRDMEIYKRKKYI